jgi:hypothetical protein
MRWFMMDSLWQTFAENFASDVYYTMDGGKELVIEDLSPVNTFSSDSPYMGSTFYFVHAGGRGED